MDSLQICLCSVCNCKEWKINMENENTRLKLEIVTLRTKVEKIKDFETCEVCDDFEQSMYGCNRCDITLCKNCYNIIYKSGKLVIDWSDPDFKHTDLDKYNELMKKYNKQELGFDLCKHCY